MKKKKRDPYWLRWYVGECPVCGSNKSYRERVYGEKPTDQKDRVVYLDDKVTYDHCIERESLGWGAL